jgi:hypothetical protein
MAQITIIDENQGIGDSLDPINVNFTFLNTLVSGITSLDLTNFTTLSASLAELQLTLNPPPPVVET